MNARPVLRLTLKRRWFEMIASGEKTEEYREPKEWILSRLRGKSYDAVEFSNGYGAHVPKVTVQYLGWATGPGREEWGGKPGERVVILLLGKVLKRENDPTVPGPNPSTQSEKASNSVKGSSFADNLEGDGPTAEERATNYRAISNLNVANRFRLMFGQPLIQESTDPCHKTN